MVNDESQESYWNHQEFDPKRVMIPVVGCFELEVHQVKGGK